MNKIALFLILISFATQAQQSAFTAGEWLKYRVSYSGFLNAGHATIQVDNATLNGKPVYHVVGQGRNSGLSRVFYKVDSRYETFLDKDKTIPYRFIRNIDEGGHTRDILVNFNHNTKQAHVHDRKHNARSSHPIPANVQDMISTMYYLRNNVDTNNLRPGYYTDVQMFYGDDSFAFRLKFLRKETIRTKFGRVETLVFRPYVESGRVFKERESLTVWITNDENKIPIRIAANLAVGSIRADLDEYKGLKHWFRIQAN